MNDVSAAGQVLEHRRKSQRNRCGEDACEFGNSHNREVPAALGCGGPLVADRQNRYIKFGRNRLGKLMCGFFDATYARPEAFCDNKDPRFHRYWGF